MHYLVLTGVAPSALSGDWDDFVFSRRHDETETEIEDGFELAIRVWPGAERLAALVDFHGNWVDWLAA